EQRASQGEVGDGQNPAEACLGPKHPEHANIEADKFHLKPPAAEQITRNRILSAQLKRLGTVVRRVCGNARRPMAIDCFGFKRTRKRTRTNMTKRPSKTASPSQSSRQSADREVDTDRGEK